MHWQRHTDQNRRESPRRPFVRTNGAARKKRAGLRTKHLKTCVLLKALRFHSPLRDAALLPPCRYAATTFDADTGPERDGLRLCSEQLPLQRQGQARRGLGVCKLRQVPREPGALQGAGRGRAHSRQHSCRGALPQAGGRRWTGGEQVREVCGHSSRPRRQQKALRPFEGEECVRLP
jgi:hypothetical protein